MPQMNKGGKFVFGESVIRPDGWARLPPQAAEEYRIASEGKVYLFTGSKMTGGFCVTLLHYKVPDGTFLPYKGRSYCWTAISASGEITLSEEMMAFLHLKPEMRLLSVRSSDIAFTMSVKGPLLEKAAQLDGEIPQF